MRRSRLIAALVLCGLPAFGATPTDAQERPRCFGAEARDPLRPCRNPRLRLSVVPRPADARNHQTAPCPTIEIIVDKPVCSFGVGASRSQRSVALVGDSHASMWRVAVTHAAVQLGWSGVRISHASCPLSKAVRDLPEPNRSHCARWKRAVFKWFERHAEVDTLVVSQLSAGSGVVPTGGRSEFETSVAGYRAAWRALPNIEHIVVIRDTPKAEGRTRACVERAMASRRSAGPACAIRRAEALRSRPGGGRRPPRRWAASPRRRSHRRVLRTTHLPAGHRRRARAP